MNDLSFLIYWADVADSLDWFFQFLMGVSIVGTIAWLLFGATISDEGPSPEEWRGWRKAGLLVLLPSFIVSAVLGSLVPSKETVYAIAASEMGERALNTPTATKAFQALEAWLDKQVNEARPN